MTERASLWTIRILAVAIAGLLWFFLTWDQREDQSDRVVQAQVIYDTGRGLMVLDPVREVGVRLQGSTRTIRTLNPFLINVVVELPDDYVGPQIVALGPENVYAPEEVEVISIEPSQINLTTDRTVEKTLPVEVELTGEPAAGAVPGTPVAVPSSVIVRGPETRLEELTTLKTRPIPLDGHATTFTEMATVEVPDSLARVEPSVVQVRVPMEPPRLSDEALAPTGSTGRRRGNGGGP